MKAVCVALILLSCGGLLPTWAAAQGERDATLAACVSHLVNAAREQKARPFGSPNVDFMLAGEQRSFGYELPHDGCLGLLAVGHRQVQDLSLTLYAPNGRIISRDHERDAHAYARVCGKAGRRVVAELRMLDGEGEMHLVPLWNGPDRLHGLSQILQNCMHAGAARPQPVDVGPEPLGPPIDVELLSVARGLVAQGYRLESGMLFGGLPERMREGRQVVLEGDRCYALAAVGDSDVEDIDLRLLRVRESTAVVAADITRRRDAVVKVCPEDSGVFVLDVRMYRGGGNYIVQSFALDEGAHPRPAGVEGGTRIPYAETLARLRRLGMRANVFTWGMLKPGEPQSIPLQLAGGHCYAVAAIATSDFVGGDLDMSLVDGQGRFAAAEQGPNPHPLVYHCTDESGTFRALLNGHDIRRPSRFLLLLGEDVVGSEVAL